MGVSAEGMQVMQSMGNVFSAAGSLTAGQSAGSGNEDYEKLAELEERDAEARARRKKEEAANQRDKLRNQQRREQARGRTGWGRSGVKLTSGSPLAVMEGQAADDEQDQQDLLAQGERAAASELSSGSAAAARYRNQAAKLRSGSSNASLANALGMTGSLLSRGGGIFD